MPTTIKPTHQAFLTYYQSHQGHQNIFHKMRRRSPFQQLLPKTAKLCDRTLVPKDAFKTSLSSPFTGKS